MTYGRAPELIEFFDLEWDEFMSYLYLPVMLPIESLDRAAGLQLPERLQFLQEIVLLALHHEMDARDDGLFDHYVYVTAKRGYASPGNPLNRPGWHTDGFGTDDINYVWCDGWPTVWSPTRFRNISPDHEESVMQFTRQVDGLMALAPRALYRFDPYVVHRAPDITAPGGMRSFLKISFSKHRYNLKGNSHNHLFQYDWEMHDRAEVRNDPHYNGADFHDA